MKLKPNLSKFIELYLKLKKNKVFFIFPNFDEK